MVVSTVGLEGPMPISTPKDLILGFIALAFKGFENSDVALFV